MLGKTREEKWILDLHGTSDQTAVACRHKDRTKLKSMAGGGEKLKESSQKVCVCDQPAN